MSRPLKIALLAGEASGDILGAGLMRELKRLQPDVEFGGIGGEKMIAQGLESQVPLERLSVMGITEVLGRLPELLSIRKAYYQWAVQWQPDVFVGIDAPDFNLGLEIKLRKAGIKTVHYVSPSVWAWRKGRLKKIRKAVDHILTLLPFEADFYHQENIPVTFVGHTLADSLPDRPATESARIQLGLPTDAPVVAMLPGSRGSEVGKLAEVFLDTLEQVAQQVQPLQVIIPAANEARHSQISEFIAAKTWSFHIHLLDKQADLALEACDAALVASGTATLQTLLWKKPMVVAYQMSAFSYWLISRLATTKWASLPNVLEQRDWVPERLQEAANVEQLTSDLMRALTDIPYRTEYVALASKWHRALALNADQQSAQAVLSLGC
ncbi:MAG: lipid-A-disaccharide synthase [Reinekea sp.]